MRLTIVTILVVTLAVVMAKRLGTKFIEQRTAPIEINYCNPELCEKNQKHIGCNNTGAFHKSCPESTVKLIDLNKFTRSILQLHNKLRNNLASGRLPNLPPASRMATMSWSKELAIVATFNAKICEVIHDDCHNTPNYRNSGQNIAFFNITLPENPAVWKTLYPTLITDSIQAWWNESANASVEQIESFPKKNEPQELKHFGLMAWENNTQVGCAAVQYELTGFIYFKFTCNYAVNYIPGAKVYNIRKKGCLAGYSRTNRYLCSTKEKF